MKFLNPKYPTTLKTANTPKAMRTNTYAGVPMSSSDLGLKVWVLSWPFGAGVDVDIINDETESEQ